MQAQAVCSASGFRFFSPRFNLFFAGGNSTKQKNYTPACARRRTFPTVCLSNKRQMMQKFVFHGRGVRIFASGDSAASGNGASYFSTSQAAAAEEIPGYSLETSSDHSNEQHLESENLDSNSSEEMQTVLSSGSCQWILAPAVLISSLLLPQFLPGAIKIVAKDKIIRNILALFASEAIFYIGLIIFLFVAEHLQRPYLSLGKYKWGLVTNHISYMYSDYLTMGIKVVAPLLAVYLLWPAIGFLAVIPVAPFLVGLAAQIVLQERLVKQKLSCWPLLTIIFEFYRFFQLNKGAYFIETLMRSTRRSANPLGDKGTALITVMVIFQVLGVVSLWTLTTFLLRLLPAKTPQEEL